MSDSFRCFWFTSGCYPSPLAVEVDHATGQCRVDWGVVEQAAAEVPLMKLLLAVRDGTVMELTGDQ